MQGRLKPQGSLFQACVFLPKRLRDQLTHSWAEVVRSEVLPAIPEAEFSHLYAEKKGRPGIPVSVFIVLSFLKEFFKLTDSQLLEAFHFNLTFLHAFGLAPGELTMAERSLYYLRERIVADPAVAKTFEVVSDTFRQKAGIVCDLQRLDSTHICIQHGQPQPPPALRAHDRELSREAAKGVARASVVCARGPATSTARATSATLPAKKVSADLRLLPRTWPP